MASYILEYKSDDEACPVFLEGMNDSKKLYYLLLLTLTLPPANNRAY